MGANGWRKLDRALDAQSFTGFNLTDIAIQDLTSLESAVASAEQQFQEVAENREWKIIARQLGVLQAQAEYIAIRVDGADMDIVIGKNPAAVQTGETYEKVERTYLEFVQRLLADIAPAAETFKLSQLTIAKANDLITSAEKSLASSTTPTPEKKIAQAVLKATRLVLPFYRYRGLFKCLVVVKISSISAPILEKWKHTDMLTFGPPFRLPKAFVEPYLWNINTGEVHSSGAFSGSIRKGTIRNLSTAKELEANLRFTG